jgi:hypothetical protein
MTFDIKTSAARVSRKVRGFVVPGTPGCLRVTLARAYQFSAWGQAYQRAVRNQARAVSLMARSG